MQRLLVNRWFHVLLLLGLLGGAVHVRMGDYRWMQSLTNVAFDAYNRLYPRSGSDQVIIVDIDDQALASVGQWPWPRTVLAQLIERLDALGARVVVFDGVLAEPDRTSPDLIFGSLAGRVDLSAVQDELKNLPSNDAVLAAAIQDSQFFVSAFTHASNSAASTPPRRVVDIVTNAATRDDFLRHAVPFNKTANFLPILEAASAGNGSFMAIAGGDGVIRRTGLVFSDQKNLYPSLGLEALRVYYRDQKEPIRIGRNVGDALLMPAYHIRIADKDIPIDSDGEIAVYYRTLDRNTDYISVAKVLNAQATADTARRLSGKIVFIGSSAEGLKDVRSSPLNAFIPGVEVHFNAVEQILQERFLLRPSILPGAELIFMIAAGVMIILFSPYIGALVMALLVSTVVGGIGYLSWSMFLSQGLLMDPVYPGLSVIALFILASLLAHMRVEAERKQVRTAFSHYISPDFMRELTENPDSLRLGGEVRDLSVMFTDIRGFTGIAEKMSPEDLIHLMNDFLTPMSALVMEHRGTIDKYMGDAMMAFWNAPLDDPDHARHACLAALRMNAALEPINETLRLRAQGQGCEPIILSAGIGVNTGHASVGNMGSRQRFAYSALGDTVNLASRLEGQTKTYGVSILIGAETAARVADMAVLELDYLRVKGKREPVRIFTVLGDEALAATAEFQTLKAEQDKMLAQYRARAFDAAEAIALQFFTQAANPLAAYHAMFVKRIAELKENHPGTGWDGVFEASSK